MLCGVPDWALFFNYALDTVFAWEVLVLVHMYGPALCLKFVLGVLHRGALPWSCLIVVGWGSSPCFRAGTLFHITSAVSFVYIPSAALVRLG